MFAVPVTRQMHAVGVLLGGSGLARAPNLLARPMAALLRPSSSVAQGADRRPENRAVGDGSC